MKKTNSNLILINMVFVVCLVISTVVAPRVITTGVTLFGNPVTIPGAALCYCLTFLSTDIISEIWGKEEANRTVKCGFIGQVIATVLIMFTGWLPIAEGYEGIDNAYQTLLGQNLWFCIGSLASYAVSQSWDVWMFHTLRNKFAKVDENGKVKGKWIWNNGSTMTSQIWDTIIFIFIAFGIGLKLPMPALINMAIGQYVFKWLLAALDTPIFYFITRLNNYDKEE